MNQFHKVKHKILKVNKIYLVHQIKGLKDNKVYQPSKLLKLIHMDTNRFYQAITSSNHLVYS